jgi:NAD(P)-dependent dehydrogenase (short-subunit alcohol dehydrogenase family)
MTAPSGPPTSNARTVLVTGGTSGLGRECAKALIDAGPEWHVVLTSRSDERAEAAASALRAATGTARIHPRALDLGSLDAVRAFTDHLRRDLTAGTLPPLYGLICNAGVQRVSGLSYTEDGFEMTFGVNHLGHFLLVNRLLDALSSGGRVVFVSSETHDPATARSLHGHITGIDAPVLASARALAHPEAADEATPDTGMARYATSKLANLMTAYELDRRLPADAALTVNAFDPGLMPATGLARDHGPVERFLWDWVLPLFRGLPGVKHPSTSGADLAWLVTAPELDGVSGRYVVGREPRRSADISYDADRAAALWRESAGLVGLDASQRELELEAGRPRTGTSS